MSKWAWLAVQLHRVSYGLLPPAILDIDINAKYRQIQVVARKLKWHLVPWVFVFAIVVLFVFLGVIYLLLLKLSLGDEMQLAVLQIIIAILTLSISSLMLSAILNYYKNWMSIAFMNLLISNRLSYRTSIEIKNLM